MVIALALALTVLAAQPRPSGDDPLATAPAERLAADPVPGLDEKSVEIPPDAKPTTEESAEPAAVAGAKTLSVEQKTVVEGRTLQVVLGQRALFRLDDKGWPVLETVEEGQLAAAHPEGAVTESFEPPPKGQLAVALDGSAEVRATVLKVWNQTDRAVDYRALALVLTQGKVTPSPAPVCAVPAGGVRTETWRRPVVAVGLSRFKSSATAKACE